jgi:hypothetical protein
MNAPFNQPAPDAPQVVIYLKVMAIFDIRVAVDLVEQQDQAFDRVGD